MDSDEEYPHLGRITRDPRVMVGKPVVRGTRIPVSRVLQHLSEKPASLDDLFAAFPRLTLDDVRACLDYARKPVDAEGRQHGVMREIGADPARR